MCKIYTQCVKDTQGTVCKRYTECVQDTHGVCVCVSVCVKDTRAASQIYEQRAKKVPACKKYSCSIRPLATTI